VTRSARRLATGLVVALLATTGCTGSSGGDGNDERPLPPGITDDQITIGSTQPLSGVAAAGYAEIALASAAYFKHVNDSGGVHNRTISYRYVDDRYDPARTRTQTRKLVDQNVFAVFNALGTATHQKVVELLNRRHVPDVFVGSGCPCWDRVHAQPYTFGWQPSYAVEGKVLGAYVKRHFAKKKVALFYQDDDFGRAGARAVARVVPHSRIVTRQSYDPADSDISDQAQEIQSTHADVVVSFSVPAFTAILQLNLLKLKAHPKLVVSSAGSDPTTLAGLLKAIAVKAHQKKVKASRLIQGIVTDSFLPSPADTRNSWVQLFRRIHDRYIPKLPFDSNVMYGMAAAYTFVQAMQAAGPDPTRDRLVAAIEHGLSAGPGLTPLRYSATSHEGYSGLQIGVIKGTAVDLIGAPMVTNGGSGAVHPYTQEQATAPAGGIPPG
jgi:ABC-type branched-subunit amino acid transport system substrate-binding protein